MMCNKAMRGALAVLSVVLLLGCEAVIDDLSATGCDPDPPTSCEDISDDPDEQHIGCCSGDETAWYCDESGTLHSKSCADDTFCDYDKSAGYMTCVR